jgi:ankyrin repeat protein
MAERGQMKMAEKCLSQILDNDKHDFVNQGSASGWTPLMAAAENDQYYFLRWLLLLDRPYRAEVNKKMKDGRTAMHVAVKKNNADIVSQLFINLGIQEILAYRKENVFDNLKKLTIDEKMLQILDKQKHIFDDY